MFFLSMYTFIIHRRLYRNSVMTVLALQRKNSSKDNTNSRQSSRSELDKSDVSPLASHPFHKFTCRLVVRMFVNSTAFRQQATLSELHPVVIHMILDFRNSKHETELASVCLKFPYNPFEHNVKQVNNMYKYKMQRSEANH